MDIAEVDNYLSAPGPYMSEWERDAAWRKELLRHGPDLGPLLFARTAMALTPLGAPTNNSSEAVRTDENVARVTVHMIALYVDLAHSTSHAGAEIASYLLDVLKIHHREGRRALAAYCLNQPGILSPLVYPQVAQHLDKDSEIVNLCCAFILCGIEPEIPSDARTRSRRIIEHFFQSDPSLSAQYTGTAEPPRLADYAQELLMTLPRYIAKVLFTESQGR